MAHGPLAWTRRDTAATCFPYACGRRPGWPAAWTAPQVALRAARRVAVPSAGVRSANQTRWGPVPRALAVAELHSSRTSHGLGHCPNLLQLLTRRTAAAFAALRRWKRSQLRLALLAIHTLVCLGTIPKTTTPFANFQMYAHFHDDFSILLSSPDGGLCCMLLRGVKRTGPDDSDFSRSDRELSPVFSSCQS